MSIVLGSRGRPDGLDQVYDASMSLAARPDLIEVFVRLDADDETSLRARMLRAPNVTYVTGPRRRMQTSLWNEAGALARGDIIFIACDDTVPETRHWDDVVREAFAAVPDRIALVYGRDGVHDERMSTVPFVSRAWIMALGYIQAPYFAAEMGDVWLYELSGAVGRRIYLPHLVTRHVDPIKHDQTGLESQARAAEGHAAYERLGGVLAADADKLRAAIARAAA